MIRVITIAGLLFFSVSSAFGLGTESFGKEAFSESNYTTWPKIMPLVNSPNRVYHWWVNGSEGFFYQGDTASLNVALRQFAAIQSERLTVVLRPGPGTTRTFDRKQTIEFDWNMELTGGISRHMSKMQFGSEIWDPNPRLSIYVDERLDLNQLHFPKGAEVVELADLEKHYTKCLQSSDKSVRGWSCAYIAHLNPYNAESMRKIVAMLKDDNDWVKLNAAGALPHYEVFADEVIAELVAIDTDDEKLQQRIQQTIEKLRKSKTDPKVQEKFLRTQTAIHKFLEEPREGGRAGELLHN